MKIIVAQLWMFALCCGVWTGLVGAPSVWAQEAADPPAIQELQALEGLIGTWRAMESGGDSATITCRWINNRSFIEFIDGSFRQVIGWDIAKNSLAGWGFGTHGGHGEIEWKSSGPAKWTISSSWIDRWGKEIPVTGSMVLEGDRMTITTTYGDGAPESTTYTRVGSGPSAGKQVQDTYLPLVAGGRWTTTVDGEEVAHTYIATDSKKWAPMSGRGGLQSFVSVLGVDPETDEFVWWVFDDEGSVSVVVMTQESDGVWYLKSRGDGSNGAPYYEGRVRRIDDNTLEQETIKHIANGKSSPAGKYIWRRQ